MKIAIDLAHGFPKDKGSVGIIAEEEVINQVGISLVKRLNNLNNEVMLVRPHRNKKNDSMNKKSLQKLRAYYCNLFDFDYIISIHANIGMGIGSEIYTFKSNEYIECSNILSNLAKVGFINRGIKDGSDIPIIKYTKAKVILVRVCFIDNLHDVNNYKNIGADIIGDAIAFGICSIPFNLENLKYDKPLYSWKERLADEIIIQGYKDIKNKLFNTNPNKVYSFNEDLYNDTNYNKIDDTYLYDNSGIKRQSDIEYTNDILAYAPKVSYGSRGNITRLIQQKLNIKDDGIFGNQTRNMLVEFQKDNDIPITGVVDRDTWIKFFD